MSASVVWNCFDNGGWLQLVKPGCSYLCRAAAQMGTKSEKKYFSAHLVLLLNCFNRRDTTGSLCGRNPFGLNERGAKDCSMQLPIKAELANPLVKQLRQEDRRGGTCKKFRACALLLKTLVHHCHAIYWVTDSFQCLRNYGQFVAAFYPDLPITSSCIGRELVILDLEWMKFRNKLIIASSHHIITSSHDNIIIS